VEPLPGAAADPALPLPNSFWVLPAQLLAGEHPAGATLEATRARLTRLLEAGVNCFIDLTQAGETPAYETVLPLTVEYLRRPIPDHGVPAERVHMRQILEYLHSAVNAGKIVYLHCRAGIGRTNLVVGCLLAERGLSGPEALVELNRVWKQSARAVNWPAVPETPEQTDYIRNWSSAAAEADPLLEPAALAAARGLRERFQGALLGLAVGDAVAAATQYRRPGHFTPVGDMLGGGPFDLPRGAWSDDTAMALCLAESLLEREGFDARDQVERYRRWRREGYLSATGQCLGITASTARALAMAQWRRQAFSGTHDPEARGAETLSRVAPAVMYFFARDTVAVQHAAEAARTTSQAPRVLAACRALGIALHAALSGQPKITILARARALSEPLVAPGTRASRTSATAALAAALDAFGTTPNFRDAVLSAANLGGNSDVVAGAAGALAGAHYSAGAIPTLWRNSLMKKQLIEGCADRLLAHAMLELAG
jgi:ADP-ribosyl-[dinitrogen reductase] hydrolase